MRILGPFEHDYTDKRDYVAITDLLVKDDKRHRVIQIRPSPQQAEPDWYLTNSEMICILRETTPDDWLFSVAKPFPFDEEPFDGFRPADRDVIEMLISALKDLKSMFIEYRLDQGVFHIFDIAYDKYLLKPSHDFIDLDLDEGT